MKWEKKSSSTLSTIPAALSVEFCSWNVGAGGFFARSCFFICWIKTLKSTCTWWIETKRRYWKKLIFPVDNGRQVLPGVIQRIKVRRLLSSLPWLLLEKVLPDPACWSQPWWRATFSFLKFSEAMCEHLAVYLSSVSADHSVHVINLPPRDT